MSVPVPSFTAWLRQQVRRRDAIGDLARDFVRDTAQAANASPAALRERLHGFLACDGAFDALDRAAAEWSAL